MKALWLGNFCPRQPVHRPLKAPAHTLHPGIADLRSGRPGWKPSTRQTRRTKSRIAATRHPAQDLLLFCCAGFNGLRKGRPRTLLSPTTSGSSASSGLARRSDEIQLSQGSSAPHRAGLQHRSLRCAGFYGLQLAGPAWKFKLLSRVHLVRPAWSSNSPQLGLGEPHPALRGRPPWNHVYSALLFTTSESTVIKEFVVIELRDLIVILFFFSLHLVLQKKD